MMDFQGKVFANFQLSTLLGEGSFARVYRGRDLHSGQDFAIKIFKSFAPDQNALEQLRREADICRSLQHAHIVRVYRFEVEQGFPYMVMDYLPLSWRQKYPVGVRLPLALVGKYLTQLGGALQHAHNMLVIHRDLKPGNLLLNQQDELFLTDFSIARVLNSSGYHNTQNISGTLSYMAPEAFEGKKLERATDQYSLGVVVYEWLTGRVPFTGTDYFQIRYAHASGTPPPSLRSFVADLPEGVERSILQALSRLPSERFQSVDAFVRSLMQAAASAISLQGRSNSGQEATPPASSHPLAGQPTAAPAASPPLKPAATPATPQARGQVYLSPPQHHNQPGPALPSHLGNLPPATPGSLPGAAQQAAGGGTAAPSSALSRPAPSASGPVGASPTQLSGRGQGPTVPAQVPPGAPTFSDSAYNQQLINLVANAQTVAGPGSSDATKTRTDGMLGQRGKAAPGATVCIYHEHVTPVKEIFWLPPDGEYLLPGVCILSVDSQMVHLWEAQVGTAISLIPLMGQKGVWSPNRAYAAHPASDGIRIYAMRGSAPTKPLAAPYKGHTGEVKAITWMPGSTYLVSGGMDRKIHVWEAATGQLVKDTLGGSYQGIYGVQVQPVTHLAASPNGRWIASAEEGGKIQVWNPRTGQTLTSYSEHQPALRQYGTISALVWSPTSERIASQAGREIRVWESRTGKTVAIHETSSTDFPLLWSRDGRRIASRNVNRSCVDIWFAASRKHLLTCECETVISAFDWSPDGKMLAAGAGRRVDVWDTTSGRCLYSYTPHTSHVTSIAWSPDGKRLASADAGGGNLGNPLIHIWTTEGIEPPPLRRFWDRTLGWFRKNPHTR